MKRLLVTIAGFVAAIGLNAVVAQEDPIMEVYEAGDGPNALYRWELIASTGDYRAQVTLGWLLSGKMDPKGVRVDLKKARYWMGMAVAQRDLALADGLDKALYEFADALYAGKMENVVGKVGAEEIIEWFALAANLGHAGAGASVGLLYKSGGDGLAPDLAQAEKWLEWAAPGSAVALLQAATLHYEQGRINRALYWLDYAWSINAQGVENVYGRDPFTDAGGFAALTSAMRRTVAGGLFPDPLAGWERRGQGHRMYAQSEGVAGVTREDDRIRYPVEMTAAYANGATGATVVLAVRLNYVDEANGFRNLMQTYEQYDDAKRRELRGRGLDVADVDRLRAFSLPGDNPSYQTGLANGVLVSSAITTSSGDAQTDRKIALDYLRAMNFEKIAEGTRGHGVFTVAEDGEIVKL